MESRLSVNLKDKQELKSTIEAEIKRLTKEASEIKAKIYPSKEQDRCDKNAHLTQKLDQSVHFQRYNETIKRLNRLQNAILKINTKDYGICQECEEPIPLARLKIVPETIYCVKCMQELCL